MDSLEPTTAEELVRLYTPELIPQADPETRILAQGFVLRRPARFTYPIVFLSLATFGIQAPALTLLLASISGIASAVATGRFARRDYEAGLRQFSKELRDSPWKFY